jgi:phenylacetate-CoA ligase
MLAVHWQLERTQWWQAERLVEAQFRQLRQLVAHGVAYAPFYADHLERTGLRDISELDPETFRRWPIVRRRDIQDNYGGLCAASVPAGHGGATETFTSGSTASPLCVLTSELAQFFAYSLVVRDHLWHRRDFRRKFAASRFFAKEAVQPGWSPSTNAAFATGPAVLFDVGEDVAAQWRWLLREKPAFLLTTPSNLSALLDVSADTGQVPYGLSQVITYAEVLPESLRERVARAWQARLIDTYSCREIGPLALQCPNTPHYHVQSENVYLEVLRDDGSACALGETGRVVVTALHNFAMPLLRYELGDFAEVGDACSCGRGLPVIRRVVGRARNMARDPRGRRFQFGLDAALTMLADVSIRQFQVIQNTLDSLDFTYMRDSDLTAEQEASLRAAMHGQLGYPFEIRFSRVSAIARSPGGKYESFICRVADA